MEDANIAENDGDYSDNRDEVIGFRSRGRNCWVYASNPDWRRIIVLHKENPN